MSIRGVRLNQGSPIPDFANLISWVLEVFYHSTDAQSAIHKPRCAGQRLPIFGTTERSGAPVRMLSMVEVNFVSTHDSLISSGTIPVFRHSRICSADKFLIFAMLIVP